METHVGKVSVSYSARGIPSYSLELWHEGLKKHRLIRDGNLDVIRRKKELQIVEWSERWALADSYQRGLNERISGQRRQEERKALALERTAEAQSELAQLSNLLKHTLTVDDKIDWALLKDRSAFPDPKPRPAKLPAAPPPPVLLREPQPTDRKYTPTLLREPQPTDPKYIPTLGFLDKLFASREAKRIEEKQAEYQSDRAKWLLAVSESEAAHAAVYQSDRAKWLFAVSESKAANAQAFREHQLVVERLNRAHTAQVQEWEHAKAAYLANQSAANTAIDEKRDSYLVANPEAIVEYCDLVLSSSQYPNYFPKEFDLDYDPGAKLLIADYALPSPDNLPKLKAVKYVASRDEFEEQYLPDSQYTKLFDDIIYQVVLRTIHELFEADTVQALQTVVFNGIVSSIDRSTGKTVSACVVSIRANREEFLAINLALVEPKTCFKSLKGVGSSKLSGLVPIPPIMPLRREDGRFVSAYEVASSLDETVNLAAMDWEDFEHLIREVFEKEFSVNGGEVKVTQASRDGGVDAVAFDPDPIRGGKIVIQAKRYTNTVGVGAVRDLYGTVLNEGATKGILVTTADFGPESYNFANGKPLVLLSGSNLLHLLQKHGHSARINLNEARKIAGKGQ